MARKAPIPYCSENDRQTLSVWVNSRSMERRLVERARIMNKLLEGEQVQKMARGRETSQKLLLSGGIALSQTGLKVCMICHVLASRRNMTRSSAVWS